MKTFTFKKIIPALLIVMILSVGIFGAFGVETAEAEERRILAPASANITGPMTWAKDYIVDGALSWTGQAVLGVLSLFLGLAGMMLDFVVTYTVIEMGANVKGTATIQGIGFIDEGWKVFRDLANIVIIFALLVIGIATILRYEAYGMKKLLGMLIIMALLINFSLFFTQIIIDASNLLASQFYQKIIDMHGAGWKGIGYAYMDAFKLTTFYSTKGFDPQTLTAGLESHQILLVAALASIVFLVAIFSFLAGVFLLISRFVVLIFLMVLSPLAFVGMILPATQSYASKWWSMLFKYSIFAPIYMILTWFVINVVTSEPFKIGIGLSDPNNSKNLAFAGIVAGGAKAVASLPIIMNFVLIIFFMMASLIIANQMGIAGSAAVMSWSKSASKWGQGVVGRGAMAPIRRGGRAIKLGTGVLAEGLQDRISKSKGGFAKTMKYVPFVTSTLGKLGEAGRDTVQKSEDKYKDKSNTTLKNLESSIMTSFADSAAIRRLLVERERGNPEEVAKYMDKLPEHVVKEIYIKMSAPDQIKIEEELRKIDKEEKANRLSGYLSIEENIKRDEALKKVNVKEIEKALKQAFIDGNEKAKRTIKSRYKELVEKDATIGLKDISGSILKQKELLDLYDDKDLKIIDIEGKIPDKKDKKDIHDYIENNGTESAKKYMKEDFIGKRAYGQSASSSLGGGEYDTN